jgi:hypothetical protein
MLKRRRVRAVAAVGVFAVTFGLLILPGEPVAEAAPRTFTIVGGGYGHGIGMSQYGAHGMALRGAGAGRIISFYYGGAQARPATLPAAVRSGCSRPTATPAPAAASAGSWSGGSRSPAWAAAAASRYRA